jgi:hypothetical protein
MNELTTLPNGRILLDALMLTPEMLRTLPKVPIPVTALRALLRALISRVPFDENFYATTYPDLAQAREAGAIADLRAHFLEHGYLEGRLGAEPEVEEEFYKEMYPDVAAGIARGEIRSASDHYVRAGAAEGRFANPAQMQVCLRWQEDFGRR